MKINLNGKEIEVADEVVSAALESETKSFDLTSDLIIVRSTDEDSVFKENLRKEGIATGAEIGRKNVLKGFELNGDGLHKSDDSAIAAINGLLDSKVTSALSDAKIKPDAKVAELLKDKQALVENMNTLKTSFDTFKAEAVQKEQNNKRVNTLSSLVPDNALNSRDITLTIMDSKLKTGFTETGVMYGIDEKGEPMKDPNTLELLPIKSVVGNFFNANPELLKKAGGGAGGSDSGGNNGKQSMEDFTKEMTDAGHQINGTEFVRILGERMKSGTLDM